ncbi:MAG: adenylate/guanylate cyclase domain-containing protein [Rhizobiaceae bacterium]
MPPKTRYARSGEYHIAYQTYGQGPDIVMVPGFVSHIENYWDEPRLVAWLEALGRFARITLFDKRGTGLSDRVAHVPSMDERMDDVRAVMDAGGIDRAALLGISEGGSLSTFFAASHPDRVQSLTLYGAFARFFHWLPTEEAFGQFLGYIQEHWGSGASLGMFAPSQSADEALQQWWGRFERLGASPSAATALMRMNREIEITGILSSVRVPTLIIHRTGDAVINVAAAHELAAGIEGARLIEHPGTDHLWFLDGLGERILSEVREMVTGERHDAFVDRVLATVLFTDIVDSTSRAASMGDVRWRALLDAHDRTVRQELSRFRGNEVKSLGDGFLATFDGPARAIRCAVSISQALKNIGVPARAGLHTGEVEITDTDVRGIAVHLASRVAGTGGAGDVVVSRTVKDLVAGSGLGFDDFGTHVLKGMPEAWQLYSLAH